MKPRHLQHLQTRWFKLDLRTSPVMFLATKAGILNPKHELFQSVFAPKSNQYCHIMKLKTVTKEM